MQPISGIATFRLLVRNQWKTSKRTYLSQQGVFMSIVILSMAIYVGFTLFILGYSFDAFAFRVFPGEDPVRVVNRYLLAGFISLFFMRFLFQRTPRMKIAPFLHLPISRNRLVTFFQISSLFSGHNFYPLIFFIPFWIRFVNPSELITGQLFWMVSVIGILLGSHFANLILRGLLKRFQGAFYALMALFILVVIVDETTGAGVIQETSIFLFSHILAGQFSSFGLVMNVVLGLAIASTVVLKKSLRAPRWSATKKRGKPLDLVVPKKFGLTGKLIYLELLLMWRNRRPRHYLLVSALFSTMYLILMLAAKSTFNARGFDALIGLFASGGFALNYGQLMFSWDSTYFDGLLARDIPMRSFIRAKLILLQSSCLLFFLIALPLFIWLKPELLGLHLAFLVFNAGITSVLVMELATRNCQAVDIEKSGSIFNYEGFSIRHWLWFFPTALPPTLWMAAMSKQPATALLMLAGVGFLSLLATEFWTRFFARGITSRKYQMAQGFRLYAR